MKRHIPNAITCCNLICGIFATIASIHLNTWDALLFIVLGATFDFFDGFAARLLKVSSPIGKELDSLADVVTFGVAPTTITFVTLYNLCEVTSSPVYLAYPALLIAAFSALRLAKFNLDTRQSLSFIGLPTPANALFWGAFMLVISSSYDFFFIGDTNWLYAHPITIILALDVLVCLSCWILISEVPMFALKFKHFGWKGNEIRYSFMLLALTLTLSGWMFTKSFIGISATILTYVLISLFTQKKSALNAT